MSYDYEITLRREPPPNSDAVEVAVASATDQTVLNTLKVIFERPNFDLPDWRERLAQKIADERIRFGVVFGLSDNPMAYMPFDGFVGALVGIFELGPEFLSAGGRFVETPPLEEEGGKHIKLNYWVNEAESLSNALMAHPAVSRAFGRVENPA